MPSQKSPFSIFIQETFLFSLKLSLITFAIFLQSTLESISKITLIAEIMTAWEDNNSNICREVTNRAEFSFLLKALWIHLFKNKQKRG